MKKHIVETVVIRFVTDTAKLDRTIKKLEKIERLQRKIAKKK